VSLVCPKCDTTSFRFFGSLECGPNGFADETTIQRARCFRCNAHFICVYSETRSFNPDRDDRVSHLAFDADPKLWERSEAIFTPQTNKVAPPENIAAAMNVLRKCQSDGTPGQSIKYRAVKPPKPETSTNPQTERNKAIRSFLGKLAGVFRLR